MTDQVVPKNYYKRAICRMPSNNPGAGLRSVDLGLPDVDLLLRQHRAYVSQLQVLGLEVCVLGALAHRGETDYIASPLKAHRKITHITEPGTLDGGDVLIIGKHCIAGLSERTNQQGAEQLKAILRKEGYQTDIVEVAEALHFKSSVNFLDENTLLVTQRCYWLDCLSDYRKLVVPEDESYAANVVWINDCILVPEGFEGTKRLLQENTYQTIEMPVSEIARMDGGLTCLSLRMT